MDQGQITPTTPFGKALEEIASNPEYKLFLDVGTWRGLGTTLCLVRGAASRLDTKILSIEANLPLYREACKNWQPAPACLELVFGKLGNTIMTSEKIKAHPRFKQIEPHYDLYYNQDVRDLARAPLVHLPRSMDVVVLDGGEFNGAGDMAAILPCRPKIIAMDDIYTMKNDVNYETLLNSGEWKLVKHGVDGNGWAIFRRQGSATGDVYGGYMEVRAP